MISEEKLKIMTKMAIYEKNEGKEDIEIGKYYKKDYMSFNYAKTWVVATLAYLVLLCFSIVYNIEMFISMLNVINWGSIIKWCAFIYILFLASYEIITYKIFTTRYNNAKKSLKVYTGYLKRLDKLYENE